MRALFDEFAEKKGAVYLVDKNSNYLYECSYDDFIVKKYWKINDRRNNWHQIMSTEIVDDCIVMYPCWHTDIVWFDKNMRRHRMDVSDFSKNDLHSIHFEMSTMSNSYAYRSSTFEIYRMSLNDNRYEKLVIDPLILGRMNGIPQGFVKTSDGAECVYLRTLANSSLLFKFIPGDESLEVLDTGVEKMVDMIVEGENCWIVDEDYNLILWNIYDGMQSKRFLGDLHSTYKENRVKILPYGDKLIVFGVFTDGTMVVIDKINLNIERTDICGITWGNDENCNSWDTGNTQVIAKNGKDNFLIQLNDGRFCHLDSECNIKVHECVDISISLKDYLGEGLVKESPVIMLESFIESIE